jgi:hypothetical protein
VCPERLTFCSSDSSPFLRTRRLAVTRRRRGTESRSKSRTFNLRLPSRITGTIDDPEVEITLTTVVAHGSYLLADQLHMSGIIATASAGLIVGNLGAKYSMSAQTWTALESFWGYVAFAKSFAEWSGGTLGRKLPVRSARPCHSAERALFTSSSCDGSFRGGIRTEILKVEIQESRGVR